MPSLVKENFHRAWKTWEARRRSLRVLPCSPCGSAASRISRENYGPERDRQRDAPALTLTTLLQRCIVNIEAVRARSCLDIPDGTRQCPAPGDRCGTREQRPTGRVDRRGRGQGNVRGCPVHGQRQRHLGAGRSSLRPHPHLRRVALAIGQLGRHRLADAIPRRRPPCDQQRVRATVDDAGVRTQTAAAEDRPPRRSRLGISIGQQRAWWRCWRGGGA